jgi:hypothetical protein
MTKFFCVETEYVRALLYDGGRWVCRREKRRWRSAAGTHFCKGRGKDGPSSRSFERGVRRDRKSGGKPPHSKREQTARAAVDCAGAGSSPSRLRIKQCWTPARKNTQERTASEGGPGKSRGEARRGGVRSFTRKKRRFRMTSWMVVPRGIRGGLRSGLTRARERAGGLGLGR